MSTIRKRTWVVLASVAICGMLLFASSAAIAKQLDAWDLLPKPEPYTTFYFNDYQNVPAKAKAGAEQRVAVTVRNMQYETTAYTYEVNVIPLGGEAKSVQKGSCTTNHDATCSIDLRFTLPLTPSPRMQVKVTLRYHGRSYDQPVATGQTQSLHYWVELTPPARSKP